VLTRERRQQLIGDVYGAIELQLVSVVHQMAHAFTVCLVCREFHYIALLGSGGHGIAAWPTSIIGGPPVRRNSVLA
jgi:hypothetical protein